MPVSMNNTILTFNDGSTQTTSAGVKSVNGQTGVVTISTGSGTVTSVATGNGLQGGTITTSGTLSVACPGWNTVGSYAGGVSIYGGNAGFTYNAGTNYGLGSSAGQLNIPGASGTWRFMTPSSGVDAQSTIHGCVACRVS